MSVTAVRDGIISQHPRDERVETAMLPSSCPQNHAANLLPLPDGTLHIAYTWFRQAIKYVHITPEWVKESAR